MSLTAGLAPVGGLKAVYFEGGLRGLGVRVVPKGGMNSEGGQPGVRLISSARLNAL
jgi:hypothetical protein